MIIFKKRRQMLTFIRLGSFIFLCFWSSQIHGQQQKVEALRLIQQRIESMKETMRSMGASQLPDPPPPPVEYKQPTEYRTQANSPTTNQKNSSYSIVSASEPSEKDSTKQGYYILPFFGFSIGYDNMGTLNPPGPLNNLSLDTETGSSYGLRVGHSWEYFYLEERVSMNSMELLSEMTSLLGSAELTGNLDSLSFQQSLGARIPFSEKIFFNIGIGIGLSRKEIDYLVVQAGTTTPIDAQSFSYWVLSYDAIFGIEFYPFSHFIAGLNYRWSRIEEIDNFSAHDLHLIEGSLGFIF
jgi:opacity protein-like surface antigen